MQTCAFLKNASLHERPLVFLVRDEGPNFFCPTGPYYSPVETAYTFSMARLLARKLSWVLIASLLADPTLAMSFDRMVDPLNRHPDFFRFEALAPSPESHTHNATGHCGVIVEQLARRDFLFRIPMVSVAFAASNGKIPHPTAYESFKAERLSERQKVTFIKEVDFRQSPFADSLKLLSGYSYDELSRLQQTPEGTRVSDDFEEKEVRRLYNLQNELWTTLRATARDPDLRAALEQPFSMTGFEHFLLYTLPSIAAHNGVYLDFFTKLKVTSKGTTFMFVLYPMFFEIRDVETPSIGQELATALRATGADVTQRLVAGGLIYPDLHVLDPFETAMTGAEATNRYQTIVQNVAFVRRTVEQTQRRVQSVLELARRFPDVDPSQTPPIDDSVARVLEGQDAAHLAEGYATRALFWEMRNLNIQQLLGEQLAANDDHEAEHVLQQFDPTQTFTKATLHDPGNRQEAMDSMIHNELIHAESGQLALDLLYGKPLEVISDLLTEASAEAAKHPGRYGVIHEQSLAAQWVLAKLLDMLDQGWHARFGMQFIDKSSVSRQDQIRMQLLKLAEVGHEADTKALAVAFKAETLKHLADRYHRNSRSPFDYETPSFPLAWKIGGSALLLSTTIGIGLFFRRRHFETKRAA